MQISFLIFFCVLKCTAKRKRGGGIASNIMEMLAIKKLKVIFKSRHALFNLIEQDKRLFVSTE